MRPLFRRRQRVSEQIHAPATLTYPYYIDEGALRALADSLAIELPTHRDLKSSKRVRAQASGLGGEAGWEEGRRVEGHIHLNMLAIQLKQKVSNREIVDGLGQIPVVNDRGILSTALAHVQNMPNDVAAGALSERLQSAYESERAREVARAKRDELSQVAIQNQMVVLRGTFMTETDERGATCVSLTHLEPAEVANESTDPDADGLNIEEEMPMPEDVGIRAVLPSENALTTAGRERLASIHRFHPAGCDRPT